MGIAQALAKMEKSIEDLIRTHEETLALVKRRSDPRDEYLIDAMEETLSDLLDAHVHNTDARSFERAYRKGK